MKKFIQFFFFFALILSVVAAVLGYRYYIFLETPLKVDEQGSVFVIPKGTGVYKIANQLVDSDIVSSSTEFLIAVYSSGNAHKLKAGEYLIKPGSTPLDFIDQLRDGKVIQYALTIVPGWTFNTLRTQIEKSSKIQHILTGLGVEDIMSKLGYPGEHPEGRFLPETYYYPAGTTDIAILQRAYHDLQEKLAQSWNTRDASNLTIKSPYEALILASIIEKETSITEEYTDIAGVYTRRLAKNMPLQADPTVIYGADKTDNGKITAEMLANQNPYNTYQNTGLPPTPIALPSARAIEAALNPKPGDSLYFVAKPDGKGHIFSENLDAHNTAVAAYRKGLP
jgi:UPF0755 protein